jgi:hypothetical protein
MLINRLCKKHPSITAAVASFLSHRFQTGGFQASGTEQDAQLTKKMTCISQYLEFKYTYNIIDPIIYLATKYIIDENKRAKLTDFGLYIAKCLPKYVQQIQVLRQILSKLVGFL